MPAALATATLANGQHVSTRVLPIDRIRLERSMKANRWTMEDNPFSTTMFVAWHALRRAGLIPKDTTYEQLIETALDLDVIEDRGQEDTSQDPTPTAAITD